MVHQVHHIPAHKMFKMNQVIKQKSGFTLIELMVIIFIIMLLAGATIVNVDLMRKKARDQARIADLNAVASALEAYKADHQYYPPAFTGDPSGLPLENLCVWFYPHSKTSYSNMVTELYNAGFFPSCPSDPLNKGSLANGCGAADESSTNPYRDYGYRYTCSTLSPDFNKCTSYDLSVHLEQSSGATGTIRDTPACLLKPACATYYETPLPTGPEYRLRNGEPAGSPCP